MKKNYKITSNEQHKGLQGEKLFDAFMNSSIFSVPMCQGLMGAAFGAETNREFWLHLQKTHQEDDMGIDFGVEIFWQIEDGFTPSGMHFFIQLKTWDRCPKSLILKDISYLEQQSRYGRECFVVWQKLSKNDLNQCLERRVLDFRRWITKNSKACQSAILRNIHKLPIRDTDWQQLDKDWIVDLIKRYLVGSRQYLLNNTYIRAFERLETLMAYVFPKSKIERTLISCGGNHFPVIIFALDNTTLLIAIDTPQMVFPDFSIASSYSIHGGNLLTFSNDEQSKYNMELERIFAGKQSIIFTDKNSQVIAVMEQEYPNRAYIPNNKLLSMKRDDYFEILERIRSICNVQTEHQG